MDFSDWGHMMLHEAAAGDTADYEQKIDWLLAQDYWPMSYELSFSQPQRQCRGLSATGPDLVARLLFLQQRGFYLRQNTARDLMTGQQDEPAALAFMLDEAGLHHTRNPEISAFVAVMTVNSHELADAAGSNGRLESLRLLHQRGWLTPERISAEQLVGACANAGQRTTTAWVIDTLCGGGTGQHPYTEELFAAAAELGSVPLLQQLRERGCPWDEWAWEAAAESGCEALLQWLRDEGCPRPVSCGKLHVGQTAWLLRTWARLCRRVLSFASAPVSFSDAVHPSPYPCRIMRRNCFTCAYV
jgi:hypothetical protein